MAGALRHRPRVLIIESSMPSGHGAADAIDLTEVQQIVRRVEPAQVLEALFAALDVNPYPLQISRRGALQHTDVRAPKHLEPLARVRWILCLVLQAVRPQVLVVSGQRWSPARG